MSRLEFSLSLSGVAIVLALVFYANVKAEKFGRSIALALFVLWLLSQLGILRQPL